MGEVLAAIPAIVSQFGPAVGSILGGAGAIKGLFGGSHEQAQIDASKYGIDQNMINSDLQRKFQDEQRAKSFADYLKTLDVQNVYNRQSAEDLFNRSMKQLASQQGFQDEQRAKSFADSLKGLDVQNVYNRQSAEDLFNRSMKQLASQQGFQSGETEKQRQYEQSILAKKLAENRGIMSKGEQIAQQGESQFLNELNAPSRELEELKKQTISNSLPAQELYRSQLASNIRRQGVRGGQAATLMGRGLGEFNQSLNKDLASLMYNDAAAKRSARGNYFASKAQAGQNRAMTPTYGY